MPFQELAQPAPTVDEAKAQAAIVSKSVVVSPAEIVEEPKIEAAPVVSGAVLDEHQNFAPKAPLQTASLLSVAELKKQGADFEGEAALIKGRVKKDVLKKYLPFFFDERDFVSYGESRRFLFVKGNCIFVYTEKIDPQPLYVIEVDTIRAEIEDPMKPDKHSFTISPQVGTNMTGTNYVTVLLKDKNSGKQSYQATFDTTHDKSLVERFVDALNVKTKYNGGKVAMASVIDDKMERKKISKN